MVGALGCALFDRHFAFAPVWPAHGWLIMLALVSQVFGWMLIATALPRLPAVETSVLLLGQPVLLGDLGRRCSSTSGCHRCNGPARRSCSPASCR